MPKKTYTLEDLLYLMQRLRHPEHGCPWDLQQTFTSLLPYTLEETYEVLVAITEEDWPGTEEELGDLLLQVVFYAQLGAEEKKFNFASIINQLVTKLIRRHPHIFPQGDLYAPANKKVTAEEAAETWQLIKQQEASSHQQPQRLLDKVPKGLPALLRAEKLQATAAKLGFDWPDVTGVIEKIEEELAELKAEIAAGNQAAAQNELGDIMFALVNLARHLKLDPEAAINSTNHRFTQRFNLVEEIINQQGGFAGADFNKLEEAYQQAKKNLYAKQA